jgi:hypothetical protein
VWSGIYGGPRLRQKRKFSVYAEVRASETTALRALSCCKKIIALGVEALRQREKTVTFEETGRAERGKSFFHHNRIKQARGLMAAREYYTFNIQNSTSNIRNPLILEASF